MPWWGWVIIAVIAVAILIPIKIKVGRKILGKKKPQEEESEEDF
jgi:hypothetical protein